MSRVEYLAGLNFPQISSIRKLDFAMIWTSWVIWSCWIGTWRGSSGWGCPGECFFFLDGLDVTLLWLLSESDSLLLDIDGDFWRYVPTENCSLRLFSGCFGWLNCNEVRDSSTSDQWFSRSWFSSSQGVIGALAHLVHVTSFGGPNGVVGNKRWTSGRAVLTSCLTSTYSARLSLM